MATNSVANSNAEIYFLNYELLRINILNLIMESDISLKEQGLAFFKMFGYFDKIDSECQLMRNSMEMHVLHSVELEISVMKLAGFNTDLANFVLEEPIGFQEFFRQVIYKEIIKENWLEHVTHLVLTFSVKNLPPINELNVRNIKNLSKSNRLRFVTLRGVVTATSAPVNYTHVANYVCKNDKCSNSVVNRLIRIHIPGASEGQTVRDDFYCQLCGWKLSENIKSRIICEKIKTEVVPIAKHVTKFQQAIVVYFRGNWSQMVQLGHVYTITALSVISYDQFWGSMNRYLEASHVIDLTDTITTPLPYCLEDAVVRKIRRLTSSAKNLGNCTSFTTPLVLAYHFADAIVPNGLFLKIKLGILCALSTNGNCTTANGKLSLLLIGEDSIVFNRLLTYAADFSPAMTTVYNSQQLKVEVRSKIDCVIEGNPLILANNGVCYLGDLDKFTLRKKMDIVQCLENEFIFVDKAKIDKDPKLPPSLPLNCQLWTYSVPSTNSNRKRGLQQTEPGDLHKCLLDAFSVVFYPEIGSNHDCVNEQMVNFTLESAISNQSADGQLTRTDFQTYLTYAQSIKTTFDEKAKEYVQAYFVASRYIRAGSGCQFATGPSINAVGVLLLLAESYAKLNLRSTVTSEDAVCAILLYEECLSARYGSSHLNVHPSLHWYTNKFETDFNEAMSVYIDFKLRLDQFIRTYGSYEE